MSADRGGGYMHVSGFLHQLLMWYELHKMMGMSCIKKNLSVCIFCLQKNFCTYFFRS